MRVGKLCSRDVVSIRRHDGVVEAARRVRDHHVGDLVTAPLASIVTVDEMLAVSTKDLANVAKVVAGQRAVDARGALQRP